MTAVSARGRSGTTLRRRILGLGALGLLLLLGLVGVAAGMSPPAARSEAAALDATAGRVALASLLLAMADQDAGLRRYAATGQADDLRPYRDGGVRAARALRRLLQVTAATPRAPRAARVAADAGEWQRWAEEARQAVAAGRGLGAAPAASGGQLLGHVRAGSRALQQALAGDAAAGDAAARRSGDLVVECAVGGSLAVGVVLVLMAFRTARLGLDPLRVLAASAARIASGERVPIPAVAGGEEVAELTAALRAWQEAAAEREVLAEQAPVGICRLDGDGRVLLINDAMPAMLGRPPRAVRGRLLLEFVHPDEQERQREALRQLLAGQVDRLATEVRGVRADGSTLWCSAVLGAVRDADGRPDGLVAIVEDVSARRAQAERAARIQRNLLPHEVPTLAGYEIAGTCLPADVVAGDFFDWVVTPAGQLDLTLADVMGKGIGAALIMATLRAALRTAPAALSPAERLRLAAGSMPLGTDDDALFVTVFHARLDLETAELRYVDAGHGYCVVRRSGGQFVALPERSLPLGVADDFQEGVVRLEPGDTLVVHSDGLVEHGDRTTDLRAFAGDLERAADAEGMVRSLVRRMPARQADDVTVVALRRLAGVPVAT